uniref:Zinc finger and SCAN domain containing 18 n=1 Tax=Pan paniscus TaxID=9597 RepID=A0A2R9AI72_PANPA
MRRVRGRADEDATAAGAWETKVKWKHQLGMVLRRNYPIW